MMHCVIYSLNKGFRPTHAKCYCDHSEEALMVRHVINHIMQSLLQFAILSKDTTPWRDHFLNGIIDDS